MNTATVPRARFAWLCIGSAIMLVALAWGTFEIVEVLAHEERTEVTTFDEPISIVDVVNESGTVAVVVRTDGRREVTVTAGISEGLRGVSTSHRIEDDRLRVRGACPDLGGTWCSVDFTIAVPEATNVRIRTGDGTVRVTGAVGDVDVASGDESIVIDGAIGPEFVAVTEHGNVSLRSSAPPESVVARSEHGHVEVIVPDEPDAFRVDVGTRHGNLAVEVRTDPTSERVIDADSEHGNVTVRYGS